MSKGCIQHLENSWKEKTNLANSMFNDGEFKRAEEHYKVALVYAELLTRNKNSCLTHAIPAHDIFAISCNNLCALYQELEELEKEEKYYNLHFFYMLLQIRLNQNRAVASLSLERNLNRIGSLYITFLKRIDNLTRVSQISSLVQITLERNRILN